MFRRILVGTDGSPTAGAALQQAIALVKAQGAALDVVCAYPSAASLAAMALDPVGATIGASAGMVEQDMRAEAESIIRDAATAAEAAGVASETKAIPGDPSDAILDTAERVDADLIIVGNRGMSGARRLFGSVPHRVAHHAACSVLIVHTP